MPVDFKKNDEFLQRNVPIVCILLSDWAMANNEWGHALLLASKMDARTYNNALANFANGLPASDPLQTLYQLMSGREPQAVTVSFQLLCFHMVVGAQIFHSN